MFPGRVLEDILFGLVVISFVSVMFITLERLGYLG